MSNIIMNINESIFGLIFLILGCFVIGTIIYLIEIFYGLI